MAPSEMRPAYLRGVDEYTDSDRRLIAAARSVVAERGIKEASADRIAKEAGVTRVTLYRRLGTRDDVLRAVYKDECARLVAKMAARYTPLDSLEWDPVRHVEDMFIGIVTDVIPSEICNRLREIGEKSVLTTLAREPDERDGLAATLVLFIKTTWRADVHTRPMDREERDELAWEIAFVLACFFNMLVEADRHAPQFEDEESMRAFARRNLVPLILRR